VILIEITRENDYPPPSIIAASAAIREEYEAKCQSCGLCCCHPMTKADGKAADDPLLSYQDTKEITYSWWHGYEQTDTETGSWMRMKDGHCIALKGEPGKSVTCGIYENRPSVCRQFEAGSEACLHLRGENINVTPVL